MASTGAVNTARQTFQDMNRTESRILDRLPELKMNLVDRLIVARR